MATEPQEQTDLGKDVERAIEEFWLNCQQHGDPKKLAMLDCGPCKIALDILKNAIRARIEEPGPTPAYVHACPRQDLESLRAIVGILADWPLIEGNANTSELRSRYARFLDRWISRYTSDAGFFDSFPLPPMSAQDPQFVAEPLPQHIFNRRHVGEPIVRTSKHNGSKQHQLSMTIYELLGFNDPDRVAAWIGEARRIAKEAAAL